MRFKRTRYMKLGGVSSKVWLITCRCRALVQALAEAVLASGHNLVATAIDPEPLRELVERYGDQLRVVPLQVTDATAVETAIEAALGAFGRHDVGARLPIADAREWRFGIDCKRMRAP